VRNNSTARFVVIIPSRLKRVDAQSFSGEFQQLSLGYFLLVWFGEKSLAALFL
jgi:hypothetical protein